MDKPSLGGSFYPADLEHLLEFIRKATQSTHLSNSGAQIKASRFCAKPKSVPKATKMDHEDAIYAIQGLPECLKIPS